MATSNIQLTLFLVTYLIVCFGLMYYCVIADPVDSQVAYKLQVTLPNKVWSLVSRFLPERQLKLANAIAERSLVFVYLAVVLGCWTVVFYYIYPWITVSNHVSEIHKYVGYIIFVACFGSWRYCMHTSPGIIIHKDFKRYDHYPYDNLLFVPMKRCETTGLLRIPRSKFDRLKYNQNVPRYDHFCGWVFNTIGEENYRWFLLFLLIHVIMCIYGSTVCGLLFWGEIIDKNLLNLEFFDRATGQTIQSTKFITFQYLFARKTWEFGVMAVMIVMTFALGAFLSYHIWLTSVNQTTNEAGKWSDITKWYKKQTKKHKDAVKKGLIKAGTKYAPSSSSSNERPVITNNNDDGDVTCTGGTTTTSSSSSNTQQHSTSDEQEQQKKEAQEKYFDPGPVPKNLYNRGFIENWKEVLFPVSLRVDSVTKYAGYSKPYTARAAAEAKKRSSEAKRIAEQESSSSATATRKRNAQPVVQQQQQQSTQAEEVARKSKST